MVGWWGDGVCGSFSSSRSLKSCLDFLHLIVQYYYIRELKEAGVINVKYILTEEIAVDYLTKPLKRQKFITNLKMMGLYKDTDRDGNKQAQPHAE
jgi:hypothetical protein